MRRRALMASTNSSLCLQESTDVYVNILAGDEVIQVNDQIVVSDPSSQRLPALLHCIGQDGVGSIGMDAEQPGEEGWKT